MSVYDWEKCVWHACSDHEWYLNRMLQLPKLKLFYWQNLRVFGKHDCVTLSQRTTRSPAVLVYSEYENVFIIGSQPLKIRKKLIAQLILITYPLQIITPSQTISSLVFLSKFRLSICQPDELRWHSVFKGFTLVTSVLNCNKTR